MANRLGWTHLEKAGARLVRTGWRTTDAQIVEWCAENGLTEGQSAEVFRGAERERALDSR